MDIKESLRTPKSIDRPDMVDEETLVEILRSKGVTEEELKNDLKKCLTLNGTYGYKQEIVLPYIGKVLAKDICDVLDKMDVDTLKGYWNDEEFREGVSALIREPGGYHEWLMVRAIPLLKEMGISMYCVKEYRDKTNICRFTIQGESGNHNGNLKTTMHNFLYYYIYRAYKIYEDEKGEKSPYKILAEQLKIFREDIIDLRYKDSKLDKFIEDYIKS